MNTFEKKFTFVDLFAGIGGFKMALHANGGECLGFSEINKDAIATYCENYQISPDTNFGDIRDIDNLPQHDLLTAGVPCQSWSIAGKNLGFDDDRGQLWNDTIYLLNKSQPKAFIFENVKGLVDPRNKSELEYIIQRIKQAGYYANYFVINSHDYGVAQNRIRIYIIGFRDKIFFDEFKLPQPVEQKKFLADILEIYPPESAVNTSINDSEQLDLFTDGLDVKVANKTQEKTSQQMSLSSKNGFNDYFLFNDLRNGATTIHSWDIIETTKRQKKICLLLLQNRRKKQFGLLDGNPLSLKQFQFLDSSIKANELDNLVKKDILKKVNYTFKVLTTDNSHLSDDEIKIIESANGEIIQLDALKTNKLLQLRNSHLLNVCESLIDKQVVQCTEERYEFKNTKISSGINGINRIFLPTSDVFPTLVASDSNDFVALKNINYSTPEEYRKKFLEEIYFGNEYRKITKEEACMIQGFPKEFKLPESRSRWMKLIGNSVSVPVIDVLIKAIVKTKAFNQIK